MYFVLHSLMEHKHFYVLFLVEVANHLLERFGVEKKIKNISDCDEGFFILLYEALTGELPEG